MLHAPMIEEQLMPEEGQGQGRRENDGKSDEPTTYIHQMRVMLSNRLNGSDASIQVRFAFRRSLLHDRMEGCKRILLEPRRLDNAKRYRVHINTPLVRKMSHKATVGRKH